MSSSQNDQVTIDRPKRSRAVLVSALAVGVLVLPAPFASSTVRTGLEVRWLAHRLGSEDRSAREEARRRLLAIGGRAIEPAIPELVACAAFDSSPPERRYDYWVFAFVGHVVEQDEASHTETYEIDRWLPAAPFNGELKTLTVETPENDLTRFHERTRLREIVVVRYPQHKYNHANPHERRLTVPLAEDERAVVDAVSERLRDLKGERPWSER